MTGTWPGGWAVFALLPFGGLVAALIAIPVGLIALRTRRHTFVVITIAIFFVFQLAAFNLGFTGGTSGIQLPIAPFSPANYNQPFYYVALVILVLTVALSWAVRRSRFGLQLLAIRDDEDRALGLGVKTRRIKLTAFVLSAIPVGMVGGLYFYFLGQIFPQFAFDPLFDVSIALMAFLGGLGTLAGPLLGALVLESLQQYFTLTFSGTGLYLIVYGVLFLVVILLLPRGGRPRRRAAVWSAGGPGRRHGGAGPTGGRPRRRRRSAAMSALLEVEGSPRPSAASTRCRPATSSVQEGAINGLIGPNGSGKTTLFNVITGYERIQQGTVHFCAAPRSPTRRPTACSGSGSAARSSSRVCSSA